MKEITAVLNEATMDTNDEYLSDGKIRIEEPGTLNSTLFFSTTIKKDVPKQTKVSVLLQKFEKTEYKNYGRTLTHNFCDYINNDKLLYPGFQKYGQVPKKCPIQANTVIDVKKFKLPLENFPTALSKGKWILIFRMDYAKTMMMLNTLYFEIVTVN